MNWKEHEELVYEQIKNSYSKKDVKFIHAGNSDSTESDIRVFYKNNNVFNIEVKMPSAQSSQFVVLNDGTKFVFSNKNKVKSNSYSDAIIKELNESYDIYKDVNKKGIKVSIETSLAKNWIISTNKNNNVKFIATILEDNKTELFELSELTDYFNIITIYRRKKSGSSKLPARNESDFRSLLNKETKDYKYERKGKKSFVEIDGSKYYKKKIYSVEMDCLYFFSPTGGNKYEIRKLGKTNNPNIIFELQIKDKNTRPKSKGLSLLINKLDELTK